MSRPATFMAVLMSASAVVLMVTSHANAQGKQMTAVISAVSPQNLDLDRRRRRKAKPRKRRPKKLLRRPRPQAEPLKVLAPDPARKTTAEALEDNARARLKRSSRLGALRMQAGAPRPDRSHVAVRPSLRPIKATRRFRVDPGQPATRPVPLNAESSKAPIKIRRGVRVRSRYAGEVVPKVR